MILSSPTKTAAHNALITLAGPQAAQATFTHQLLGGGSEAAEVARFSARYLDARGKTQRVAFVIKHLKGRSRRESTIYRDLVSRHAPDVAPRLLDVQHTEHGSFLVAEAINRLNAWPWKNPVLTSALMQQLGRFHADTADAVMPPCDWNYEEELLQSAQETRDCLQECRSDPDLAFLTRHAGTLNTVVENLPRLRGSLLSEGPFQKRPIHGDVHPGNATIRQGRARRPVLLDWGRARPGSPLEDVSSILQTLRLYEPRAMQGHDRLLKDYLSGLGSDRRLTDPLRSAYWVAGASNALAGALKVHLMVAADRSRGGRERKNAAWTARDWLRIIRRSHAWAL